MHLDLKDKSHFSIDDIFYSFMDLKKFMITFVKSLTLRMGCSKAC